MVSNKSTEIINNIEYIIHSITKQLEIQHGYGDFSFDELKIIVKIMCQIFCTNQQRVVLKFCTEEEVFSYIIHLDTEKMVGWEKLTGDPPNSCLQWVIHLPTLQKYFEKGYFALILAILRGKGIQSSKDLPDIIKLGKKLQISDEGLQTVLEWFFPYAGLGFILYDSSSFSSFIISGGKKPQIKKQYYKSKNSTIREITKSFRYEKNIPLAIGFDVSYFISICKKSDIDILDFLREYGTNWCFSLPIEPDDFYIHFDTLVSILSLRIPAQKILQTKQSVQALLGKYYSHFKKYLSENTIYIKLHGENKKLNLAIQESSIHETEKEEHDFSFNVDSLNTWSAWLNDKSLRLFARFLDSVMPVHWFNDVSYSEVLVQLWLTDEKKNKFQAFIYGSDHSSDSKTWSGDFCVFLVQNDKVLHDELINGKITLRQKDSKLEVFFPLHSTLENSSLSFEEMESCHFSRGISHLISKTSILSEIAPGIRNNFFEGSLITGQNIKIGTKIYPVEKGKVFANFTHGRQIRNNQIEGSIYSFILENESYFLTDANTISPKKYHEEFLKKTEIKGVKIKANNVVYYDHENLSFPRYTNRNGIISAKNKERNEQMISNCKFRILKTWLTPHVTSGTYRSKIACIVDMKKQDKGFAILEFPCYLPKTFLPQEIVELKTKLTPTKIQMFMDNVLIFYIQHPSFSVFHRWFK